jgi:hypothetical protein
MCSSSEPRAVEEAGPRSALRCSFVLRRRSRSFFRVARRCPLSPIPSLREVCSWLEG